MNSDIAITELKDEIADCRGAIEADNQRLVDAAEKAGIGYTGCDTADWLAEYVRLLRNERNELRAERSDTIELCETIEAWVTKLDDDGGIMPEPPWYRHLITQIAFMKGEM